MELQDDKLHQNFITQLIVKSVLHDPWAKAVHGTLSHPPLSAAYMRWWTGRSLVQIMACHLVGAMPLSEPMLEYCWTLKNKLHWNFNRYLCFIIQRNTIENVVCEMAAILSRERWVICTSTLLMLRSESSMKILSIQWLPVMTPWLLALTGQQQPCYLQSRKTPPCHYDQWFQLPMSSQCQDWYKMQICLNLSSNKFNI